MKNRGVAPCTAMSLTQWLTRSAPTVWCTLHFEGELQLGADAIDAGDQDRVGEFLSCRLENRPPNPPISLRTPLVEGLMREVLDALFGAIGAVDVDAGVGVSDGGSFRRVVGH